MNNVNINDFTGQGLIYPIRLTPNGSAVIGGGLELLRSSIQVIFSYEYGTRFFLYEFGLELRNLLETPNDDILLNLLEHRLSTQLTMWEPRINLLSVKVTRRKTGSAIDIHLEIGLKGTDIKETIIFPFSNDI